jgi:hypothetical protein
MPRNPIDYSKSMFYKLVCKDLTITDLYVGSTTDFKSRKNNHKTKCYNENGKSYNFRVYKFIREHGGFKNWNMIVIHRQSCIDSIESHTIERQYTEALGATLNSCVPSRTGKEWYETNKDRVKEIQLTYVNENKDKIKETHSIYYQNDKERLDAINVKYREDNKEEIDKYQKNYRDLHKDKTKDCNISYREENKEKLKEQSKIYREANKVAIKASKKLAYEKKKLLKQESLGVLI